MTSYTASLRDELVGHSTLAVLALLGMALYSTTYSLTFMGSSSTPVVAVLEMWMVSTHLLSAGVCCVGQALVVSVFDLRHPVAHVAEAQTAMFLGVALSVTLLSASCVSSVTGNECAVYYGAAALPRFAAVGAASWSWILYAASLGCQSWSATDDDDADEDKDEDKDDDDDDERPRGGRLSLGLSGRSGLTAAATMAWIPWCVRVVPLVRAARTRARPSF